MSQPFNRPLMVFTLLAQAVPATASERELWEGYWTHNASWCARAGEMGDETPDNYSREGFFGIEWGCDIAEKQALPFHNAWAITLSCLDAGHDYTEDRLMLVTDSDRLLFIDTGGATWDMVRCNDPE